MRICTKCKLEKPVTDFYKATRRKDGLQPACKSCMNVSYKTSRSKKREHYNKVRNNRYKDTVKRIREWKEERGCACCPENFGPCLELHHPDPSVKEFNPSETAVYSFDKFLREAAKCIVVCANCHRKIHHDIIRV